MGTNKTNGGNSRKYSKAGKILRGLGKAAIVIVPIVISVISGGKIKK